MTTDESIELLRDATERAAVYLESLDQRRVAPSEKVLLDLERFEESFPEQGKSERETIGLLDEAGSPNTILSTGGRFFGFVNGGTLPVVLAAHTLATAWDQNAALSVMSPAVSKIQTVTSRWIVDALQLPEKCAAFFVGGASVANLCGVVAGRDHLLAQLGYDVAARGLAGAPRINVVAGGAVHSTMAKALSIAGLGRDSVQLVPTDSEGRMTVGELDKAVSAGTAETDAPTLILAQAGEVNSGAFDPFDQIADWAEGRNAWVHVDGAFGLWAAASPSKRHLVKGIERADSWATDGHKWLNVPYDSGIVLVRDSNALRRSMSISAAYLPEGDVLEAMHHVPQSSQRARAVDAWAALRTLGRTGLADLIDRTCGHAQRFAKGLSTAGFEVLNDVGLNQVLVSFGSDEQTQAVIAKLQAGGECWCGPTVWRGRTAMRISVSCWATTEEDVERSLAAMILAAKEEP